MSAPALDMPAIDFTTPTADGKSFHLAAHLGHPVVLYFYAEDNSEGCTLQNQEFSALLPEFTKLRAAVLGISPDPADKHRKFIAKHQLKVNLAADTEHAAIKALDVWQTKKLYGREYDGVVRTSFIIAPDGTIASILRATRIKGHAQKVLDELAILSKNWTN